jgi:Fic family protein
LFDWHASLFPTGRIGMQKITVGAWRREEDGPMQVVSGLYGRERVHFEAPEAERLNAEMTTFLKWFNAGAGRGDNPQASKAHPHVGALAGSSAGGDAGRYISHGPLDPVLKAGLAHFWFVTMHPFVEGNGRIARAIADMALARADGTKERFYSMSSQIAVERKDYYLELERAQRGELDVTGWLEWFLGCLGRALEGADAALGAVLNKAKLWERINRRPVNERQRLVINRLLNGFKGHLTTSKYAKLAKCSTDTALRDIQELVERRILLQNAGGGRSTSYRLGDAGE